MHGADDNADINGILKEILDKIPEPCDEDGHEEAVCEPGGNYGFCKTHPTCELVQKMFGDLKKSNRCVRCGFPSDGKIERHPPEHFAGKYEYILPENRYVANKGAREWTKEDREFLLSEFKVFCKDSDRFESPESFMVFLGILSGAYNGKRMKVDALSGPSKELNEKSV